MNLTKGKLAPLANETNFIRDNLEKTIRLSYILKFLNTDYYFKDKFVLKGGTAINLTVLDWPRLSNNINLDFIKNISNKEEMKEVKIKIKTRLVDYMFEQGYISIPTIRETYTVSAFVFGYRNNSYNKDNIKIEINFMDRCHILPLEYKPVLGNGILDDYEILTLNKVELYGSKLNALLSRAAPRDLYDVNNMIDNNVIEDKILLKKCLIFYILISGDYDLNNINFNKINEINYSKIRSKLSSVLKKNEKFDYETAKIKVTNYLKELLIFDDEEKEFIELFKNKIYKPELLFKDKNIVENIKDHPMALWRCMK